MRKLIFAALLVVLIGFTSHTHAALKDNGVDLQGNRLIYDTEQHITWYDAPAVLRTWGDSIAWAATLTAGNTVAGTWRLPSTLDGPYSSGFNGTTTWGWNITTSEMGHLFYTELGNKGYYDVNGQGPQSGYGLVHKGSFINLNDISNFYWSGTTYSDAPIAAYAFTFYAGEQLATFKDILYGYALAVYDGEVVGAPVPIPGAILLFVPGLAGLIAVKRRIKK
jgi:hypothetical protein